MSALDDITPAHITELVYVDAADSMEASDSTFVFPADHEHKYQSFGWNLTNVVKGAPSGNSSFDITLTDDSDESRTFRINITATEVRNVG